MMDEQMPAAAAAPAEAKPAMPGQEDGGAGDVGEKLVLLSTSLQSIVQGLGSEKSVPPEALEAIQTASAAYDKFLSIVGGKMGIQAPQGPAAPKGGMVPADSGGRGSMPADMPMGKGIKAQPAM